MRDEYPTQSCETAGPSSLPQPLFLTGPTGSGKTTLGVLLAERIGAEIISMDSMAIYRRMDIGTAKPSLEDRRRIRHHLIDVLEPWEEYSLAQYLQAAREATEQIRRRQRLMLFVGGTPLYLKSLLRGVDSGPPPDAVLRASLVREATLHGNEFLHRRLAAVDAAAAAKIHPHDLRRIVRALEVYEKTGEPISARQVHFSGPANQTATVIWLDLPREELYRRINERVAVMFDRGLIDEVRALRNLDLPLSRTARPAVGYKEAIECVEGRRSLPETIELVQRRSRQFAKRQLTWFRSLPECRRVPAELAADPDRFLAALTVKTDGLPPAPLHAEQECGQGPAGRPSR